VRAVIVAELAIAAILAVVFLAAFGLPWRQPERIVGWYIAAFSWAVAALVGLLIAAMLGVHIPLVVGMLVLAVLDAALGLQLALLIRSRRQRRTG
jgi:hypothetical protein